MANNNPAEVTVKETISTVKDTISTVEDTITVVEQSMGIYKPADPTESVYTAEELAANYKVFNTSREIVVVALRIAGIKVTTFEGAKKIINEFKNKEVK